MSSALPICVVLLGSLEEVHAGLRGLEPSVSLVELRLDAMPELAGFQGLGLGPSATRPPLDLEAEAALGDLIASAGLPLLATCRPKREGGHWTGTEESRLALLVAAAEAGAAWIDVEADAVDALAPLPEGVQIVISRHPDALSEPPCDRPRAIATLLASLRSPRASATKLALPCCDARDALTLLRLASAEALPCAAIGMGFRGVATRLLGPSAGAPWTYASAPGAPPAAPGQLSALDLAGLPAKAQSWFGVLGNPVQHSRSPHLMNAVFQRLGLAAAYTWLETEDPLGLFEEATLDSRWAGFSVTIPHKGALLDRVELAPEAAAAGALNTLVRGPEGWRGHNTDGLAVGDLLRARLGTDLTGLKVALLGNGGAARAAAAVLVGLGAEVQVYARHEGRGRAFANDFGITWGGPLATISTSDDPAGPRLILNATSVGMTPAEEKSPVPAEVFGPGRIAYDLVYTPPETLFLRQAQARGAEVISGVDHFLAQARAQLGLFWGERVDALPDLDDPWWLEAARLEAVADRGPSGLHQ